ncbi:MAG: STAS domain-containing protein [Stenomitos rutilans HA7619-LM2]|jgi:anti-anti-sigma factor|nr:STAS domain-containing protein [Stenomitos rutilans HA7619-LM2]
MSFSIQVIQPSNFLSTAAINLFHAEVKRMLESDAAIVLVDFGNITAMSSSSFIAVVKALKSVRASKRQIALCSMNEQVRILFELTGLDQSLKIFRDADEFNQYLQAHENIVEVSRSVKPSLVKRESLKLAS